VRRNPFTPPRICSASSITTAANRSSILHRFARRRARRVTGTSVSLMTRLSHVETILLATVRISPR
jgi:hypothetical protein